MGIHVVFFPLMAHGHMIPATDMARMFAIRGVKTTIVTTPLNAPLFDNAIQRNRTLGIEINLKIIGFPSSKDSGLPEEVENLDAATSAETSGKFFKATAMLQQPLEHFLQECRPHCLVADMFFPWATEAAAKFGIPRLVFHGTSFFALCISEALKPCKPYKSISSMSGSFIVPNLPDEIKLKKSQLPHRVSENVRNTFTRLRSYGVIVNSFYELEPAYADYYQNVLRRKAWHIGPVSLCNKDTEDKAQRGKKASIDEDKFLQWLNSKQSNSVVYVCFGSVTKFSAAQLLEIAVGLEASGQQFIWVVRKGGDDEEEEGEKWLLEGFEERMKGRGLIIRGWAPQILILEHEAVGGFVTHCGWNSTLEGVCAGVPMVTWPVFEEQFHNEKLVTQILRIGVGVGAQQRVRMVGDGVKREAIEKAVRRIMVGEEALEMRSRAKVLAEMARRAFEEGGSSHSDLNCLIEELCS